MPDNGIFYVFNHLNKNQVNSVVLVSSDGGLCSGNLINNTANDNRQLILYAGHLDKL